MGSYITNKKPLWLDQNTCTKLSTNKNICNQFCIPFRHGPAVCLLPMAFQDRAVSLLRWSQILRQNFKVGVMDDDYHFVNCILRITRPIIVSSTKLLIKCFITIVRIQNMAYHHYIANTDGTHTVSRCEKVNAIPSIFAVFSKVCKR